MPYIPRKANGSLDEEKITSACVIYSGEVIVGFILTIDGVNVYTPFTDKLYSELKALFKAALKGDDILGLWHFKEENLPRIEAIARMFAGPQPSTSPKP